MKKLFALLLLFPLFVVGCNDDKGNGPSKFEPSLELTSAEVMDFDAEGGKGEITYTLKKVSTPGGEADVVDKVSPVGIRTAQDWITILYDESIYGVVKFLVAENTSEEQRKGVITVVYSEMSFDVAINQAAATVAPAPSLEGWYVVGSMTNNWDVTAGIAMEQIEGYFVARGVEVATTDSFKFAKDGTLQNSLGGNGQAAERDYKYPIAKYGSDIRVKEAGVYDLYLNEAADTYYVMSEGKTPAEANEEIAQGEDIWYVTGLGETQRMRKSGIFQSITSVELDEDGFKLYHSLNNLTYGAAEDSTAEIGEEIAVSSDAEASIKVEAESNKLYDIYFSVEMSKLWVMPRGSKPDVLHTCNYAEGVWFTTKNFMISLKADGMRITLDCDSAVDHENAIIPEATYSVGGENGYVINVEGCEIANEDGKNQIYSGSVTITHLEGGYDIYVDVVTIKQHRIRAQYTGKVSSNQFMGGSVTNPEK